MGDVLQRWRDDNGKRERAFGAAIDATPDPKEWDAVLHIVSWGDEGNVMLTGKLGYFQDRIYGGYAFSRMN